MMNNIVKVIRLFVIIILLSTVSYFQGFKNGRYDNNNNDYKQLLNKEKCVHQLLIDAVYTLQFVNKTAYDSLATLPVSKEYTKLVEESVFEPPYNLNIDIIGGLTDDTDNGTADDIAWH